MIALYDLAGGDLVPIAALTAETGHLPFRD